MVSLVDIGPSKGTVEVRGHDLDINGLTAEHIVGVLISFPEVRKVLAQREVDLGGLIAQFPNAVAMIIASATGHADEAAHIEAASKLTVGEQYDILTKVMELTFPKGLKSFLDGVQGALQQAGVPGWDQATNLPAQSNGVSKPEGPSETVGTVPPSN
jgi:hypothetical protein